jgi:3-oxoacyl-[acyl-carrier protein] reductase
VWINGRDAARLEAAAAQIKADTGAVVQLAVGDMDKPEGRAALLAACPDPDILVNNPRPHRRAAGRSGR